MDQNKKVQATQNGKLDLRDYEIAKKRPLCASLERHLFGPVEMTLGECIFRVTHPNGKSYQDLIFNSVNLTEV